MSEKYVVEVEYVYSATGDPRKGPGGAGNPATDPAKLKSRFGEALESVGTGITSLAGKAADMFTGAVERVGQLGAALGTVAAVGAIGALTYGVTGLNNELEKANISIAAVMNRNGVANGLTDGLEKSSALLIRMRQDAAALPGETRDLQGIFKTIAIPGFMAGKSADELEQFSAKTMAFGMGVAGMSGDVTGREMAMLLEGRAGAHNVLGMQLAGLGGDKAKAFNAMSGEARFEFLSKEIEKYAGAIDLYGKSYDGLSSTLRDNAKQFLLATTGQVFEHIKGSLTTINEWFDSHRGQVDAFASYLGGRLAHAFDGGVAFIEKWAPAVEIFARNAFSKLAEVFEQARPIVKAIGDEIRSFLSNPAAFERIESMLKLYAAVKIGGMVASPLGGAASGAFSIGKMLSGGAGVSGAAGAGGMTELLGGLSVAGPASVALGAALLVAGGAMHSLIDETSSMHVEAKEASETIGSNFTTAMRDMDPALRTVKGGFVDLADFLGTTWLTSMSVGTSLLANWLDDMKGLTGYINTLFGGIEAGVDRIGKAAAKAKILDEGRDYMTDKPGSLSKKGGGGGGGGTFIAKVEISIATNQSPSRIARAALDLAAQRSRDRTSSPHAPDFSSGRRV